MTDLSKVLMVTILAASACTSDGDASGRAATVAEAMVTDTQASDAVPANSDDGSSADIIGDNGVQPCAGKLTQLLASKGPVLTLEDIPDSAVRAEFRPDLYRTLAPMFESSRLLPDGHNLPDGTALNEHVIFRAEGPTVNLIVLFDGHLPCPRAGCAMLAYHEDRAAKTLSRIYLNSKRTTLASWAPPRAVFGDCGVESIYFVGSLDNNESGPDRFRSKLGDLEIVHMMAAKPLKE